MAPQQSGQAPAPSWHRAGQSGLGSAPGPAPAPAQPKASQMPHLPALLQGCGGQASPWYPTAARPGGSPTGLRRPASSLLPRPLAATLLPPFLHLCPPLSAGALPPTGAQRQDTGDQHRPWCPRSCSTPRPWGGPHPGTAESNHQRTQAVRLLSPPTLQLRTRRPGTKRQPVTPGGPTAGTLGPVCSACPWRGPSSSSLRAQLAAGGAGPRPEPQPRRRTTKRSLSSHMAVRSGDEAPKAPGPLPSRGFLPQAEQIHPSHQHPPGPTAPGSCPLSSFFAPHGHEGLPSIPGPCHLSPSLRALAGGYGLRGFPQIHGPTSQAQVPRGRTFHRKDRSLQGSSCSHVRIRRGPHLTGPRPPRMGKCRDRGTRGLRAKTEAELYQPGEAKECQQRPGSDGRAETDSRSQPPSQEP